MDKDAINKRIYTIDKVFFIILCVNIALLTLLVGSMHNSPRVIFETVIILEVLIYIVLKKMYKEKNIVVKGKIDVFVLLLIISTFVPLIFNTYYSLYDTVRWCIEYLCAYSVYLLARNTVKTTKHKNIVIDVTLATSVVIVIFGIDKLYYNFFAPFLKYIKSSNSDANRMVSTFGYANVVGAYISMLAVMAFGKYFNVKNKWVKGLLAAYIQVAMIGFVFASCRAVMVIFAVMLCTLLLLLKEKSQRAEVCSIVIISLVLAFTYKYLCGACLKSNLLIWVGLVLITTIAYFINVLINSLIIKQLNKITKKQWLLLVIAILLLTTVLIVVLLQIEEVVVIKESYKTISILRSNG